MKGNSKQLTAGEIEAAERQKQAIEAYWRERGYEVSVTAHHSRHFSTLDRCRPPSISSDMINGLPRGYCRTSRLDRLRKQRGHV
jgi:hypothetical protein